MQQDPPESRSKRRQMTTLFQTYYPEGEGVVEAMHGKHDGEIERSIRLLIDVGSHSMKYSWGSNKYPPSSSCQSQNEELSTR